METEFFPVSNVKLLPLSRRFGLVPDSLRLKFDYLGRRLLGLALFPKLDSPPCD